MASIRFNNVYLDSWKSLTGPMESNSKLKNIEIKMKDYYLGEKTFEQAEIKMQRLVVESLLNKENLSLEDIDIIVGGDLLDQLSTTNQALNMMPISLLGIYSACATFAESLIVGAMFLQDRGIKNVITVASSHNLSAEKQFRYPIEYGYPKKKTSTFTSTAAVSSLLKKGDGKIKVESATIGKVMELGIKDSSNLGAVMAPAAALTLFEHLRDLKRDISYYDLVLTGDLGCVGMDIFREYILKNYDIKLKKHIDAGCELYLDSDNVFAGGSGPVCLPLVLFNKILSNNRYKKILIIGTGSLHSRTSINQHLPIPAIAHAVSLEVL